MSLKIRKRRKKRRKKKPSKGFEPEALKGYAVGLATRAEKAKRRKERKR